MKKNISVFILLILLASSFKYRSKAREASIVSVPNAAEKAAWAEKAAFDSLMVHLDEANRQLAAGNTMPLKKLWSGREDVTFLCAGARKDAKGWKAVETSLQQFAKDLPQHNQFTSETIATYKGKDQACILQKERYLPANGKGVTIQATTLVRKEMNAWKIVHKQADILPSGK
ncbi:nuclear transport factor 2 family protein [Dyadobacter sandarakinus]|uniref:Nuclear transport factor 2 family protein n=1 Tax=Dyadobacter sandarakinus TaxID=2747268 RepID=A0ABX7IC62_9BACT|nr:nuclear transport factor 2 family protein [Dyadobacter sandarakinus]QRR03691.1 nuclear transport factor 2 family protein [Dyadobacter sandarakinus]